MGDCLLIMGNWVFTINMLRVIWYSTKVYLVPFLCITCLARGFDAITAKINLQETLGHHWESHPDEKFSAMKPYLNEEKKICQCKKMHYQFSPTDITGGIECMTINEVTLGTLIMNTDTSMIHGALQPKCKKSQPIPPKI